MGETNCKLSMFLNKAKVLGCTVEDLYELNGAEEYRKAECKNDVAVFKIVSGNSRLFNCRDESAPSAP